MIPTVNRSLRDSLSRLGLADAAFWAYGMASKVNPAVVMSNSRYRREGAPDGLPIPPSDLIFLVAGTADISWFLKGGSLAAESITDAMRQSGAPVEKLGSILDFGCGCGRVLRHWHSLPDTRVCGVDYNPSLVAWCKANLPFAEVRINQLAPPLPYDDNEFDLVYALSVFTHLTEDLQSAWIKELSRVVKPGGFLVISTHGQRYMHRLNEQEKAQFESGRLVVKNNTKAPGSNMCSAYHPSAYVRDRMAAGLEMVQFVPEGARGNPKQDLYVLRKPTDQTHREDGLTN
jgi:SAM-dependent methyltransferase